MERHTRDERRVIPGSRITVSCDRGEHSGKYGCGGTVRLGNAGTARCACACHKEKRTAAVRE